MPSELEREIAASFSSVDSFKATFLATANAMFGPGFVWLVRLTSPPDHSAIPKTTLSILTTYIAGSPYPGAHFRQQPSDLATADNMVEKGLSAQAYALASQARPGSTMANPLVGAAGAFGRYAKASTTTGPGGQDLEVLMCVNTWEHVYLRDWGFHEKEQYLAAWWDAVDWNMVNNNMLAAAAVQLPGVARWPVQYTRPRY
jgi:Fe-Mn family superoxide dismutase